MGPIESVLLHDVLLRGSLLLLLAGLAAALLRSAAHRHLAWCLGLGAQLVLPVVVLLGPELHLALPRWTAAISKGGLPAHAMVTETGNAHSPPAGLDQGRPAPVRLHHTAEAVPASIIASPDLGPPALAFAWVFGALLLLISLLRSTLRRRRLLREAVPATATRWRRLVTLTAARLNIEKLPRLFIGASGSMPSTWGTWRPVVLLPQEAAEWPNQLCRDVLVHELAHVGRRDYLSQRLALLVRALLWPNPLVWWASHRLAVESERACDDLVLGIGMRPSRYAEHLLEAARALRLTARGGCHPVLGLGMAGRSQLAGRIASILDQTRCRTPVDRKNLLFATLLAMAILLPVAAAVPVSPAPPATPKPPTPIPASPSPAVPPQILDRLAPAPSSTPASNRLPEPVPEPGFVPAAGPAPQPDPVPAAEPVPQLDPMPVAEPEPVQSPPSSQPNQGPSPISASPSLGPLNLNPGRADLPGAPEVSAPVAPESTQPPVLEDSGTSPLSSAPGPGGTPQQQLVAVPKAWGSPSFVFQRDGSSVAQLTASRWKPKARLRVGESVFDLYRERRWSGDFVLAGGDSVIARATRPSAMRSAYTLQWADATYTLHPRSMTRRAFVLVDGEHELGVVARESWHSRRARVLLPADWPLEIRVFAFWLTELRWQDEEDQNAALRGVTAAAVGQ